LQDFKKLLTYSVDDVVSLFERVQDHLSWEDESSGADRTLLDDLEPYLYGCTPVEAALSKSLAAFRDHPHIKHRILVLISCGLSTDGDPLDLKGELKREQVMIATVYLTDDDAMAQRQLYDHSSFAYDPSYLYDLFDRARLSLLNVASVVEVVQHPIPVLASIGWGVPSSGRCALFLTANSKALGEFCSALLSARFDSADALLDILGKVELDSFINDEQARTCNNPSDQGRSPVCYAHAIAAVIHIALVRIVGREGGHPTIAAIRERILLRFPAGPGGRSVYEVLQECMRWYRPLRFKEVGEDGARQAVLHRRPVLATFRLSKPGRQAFSRFYQDPFTCQSVLNKSLMAPYRSLPDGGGHAVVLVKCDPDGLTFLNSWGNQWGNNGSFSIEDSRVLEIDSIPKYGQMSFYDIYWLESELTRGEIQAYDAKVDESLREHSSQHPSIFDLEVQCPRCNHVAEIAKFTGSIRLATCPLCMQSFKPEPGYLMQALYIRAGINDSEQKSRQQLNQHHAHRVRGLTFLRKKVYIFKRIIRRFTNLR